MRKMVGIASILVLALTGTALAEDPTQPPPGQPPPGDPAYQQQPYQQQPPPGDPAYQQQQGGVPVVEQQQPQVPPDQRPSRGLEYGGHIIFPIYLGTVNVFDMSPGIGIQGRIGWEFGAVTTELNIGGQVNGIANAVEDASLNNVWVGAGIRYSFFNPSALVPFAGAGLTLNFWGITVCDDMACLESDTREVTLSFNGLVGAAWELSPEIAIEFILQYNYSLPGNAFTDEDGDPQGISWLSPGIGGTLYF